MKRRYNPVVTIVVAIFFVVIILILDPSGKILGTIVAYFKTSLGILMG